MENTFYYIKKPEDVEILICDLTKRVGMSTPVIRGRPESFPVLLTYCINFDMNGTSINLKCLSPENVTAIMS